MLEGKSMPSNMAGGKSASQQKLHTDYVDQ